MTGVTKRGKTMNKDEELYHSTNIFMSFCHNLDQNPQEEKDLATEIKVFPGSYFIKELETFLTFNEM